MTEYVEGTAQCEDCHARLVPGSPPEAYPQVGEFDETRDVKLVTVRTFSGPSARLLADLARNVLLKKGIPCMVPGETEMFVGLEVPLLVREEDRDRATQTMKDYFDSPGPIPVQ